MKKLFFIFFILICSLSYSKEHKSNDISNIDYSLKSMIKLDEFVNTSVKFKKYCWERPQEISGCFRNSSIMLLGYNNNSFAYLYRIEPQSEDMGVIYKIKVQNFVTNQVLLDEKFLNVMESNYLNKDKDLISIYLKNKDQIVKKIQKYKISISKFSVKYIPYNNDNTFVFLGVSTVKKDVQFGYDYSKVDILNNLIAKKSGKLIFKQNYSTGSFCKECVYPFFNMDPLVIIQLPNNKKLLAIALLSYDFHSPLTLQYQFIGI